jgi:two-component system response regulator DevR
MTAPIRVFLVDDHEIVRRGIAELLREEPDIEVVGEASTALQAMQLIRATRPDVAVLDVRLPDGSGIDLCRDARAADPALRCLILTAYDDEEALDAAIIAGASGYVLKQVRASGLIDSVRRVAAGEHLIEPELGRAARSRLRGAGPAGDPRLARLSARERDVLALIADGLANREIGVLLSISEKTVKNYVSSILAKLGLQRRTQAAIIQIESTR